MKVINSINNHYYQQYDSIEILSNKVEGIINALKQKGWYYFGRIKTPESFALKIETGRADPTQLEDFFACTIVVENYEQIQKAIETIERFCVIIRRRPPFNDHTTKSSSAFSFDDLRLYVKLRPTNDLPPESTVNALSDILFEIQIKTFLQHAWGIATHDLVYKGDDISWSKQRIAYQIKAMFEHAEVSIHEIEKIKESTMLTKTNDEVKRLNEIKTFLKKNWESHALPMDLKRISETISVLLDQLNISPEKLQIHLDTETTLGRGRSTLNLSPYFIILQTIINQNQQIISNFFSNRYLKNRIVIPPEINVNNLTMNERKIIRI
ncbi:hypothetical protein [Candidatus Nitrosotenuis sp. DW1]|uniref:hypothetical protein n=1 Tax=Candidatus Nitrosotenuis sp. DW1 TaxID=2259672 RepID=UPI0015CE2EDC|nr:hypothetical protein [Candidatus Nitrosotenuis sp. DW1]QLH08565.1 hypothetical protein DSQ19_02915 [Candidatus Nitrosotenuis sp. DW1]